jgi:hypothetical protein
MLWGEQILTAMERSSADPGSNTHVGVWLDEDNQWCVAFPNSSVLVE